MKTLKHILTLLFISILLFAISDCEKQKIEPETPIVDYKSAVLSEMVNIEDDIVVFGPEVYTRGKGKPSVISKEIEIEHYEHFEPTFTIFIENGDGGHSVTSAEIMIDGEVVFAQNDFSNKKIEINKEINLTEKFDLEVEVRGKPESFIKVSIIATLKPGHGLISKNKGGVVVSEDLLIEINIPPGAISEEEMFISIEKAEEDNSSLKGYTTVYGPYEISSNQERFNKLVDIHFKIVDDDKNGIIDGTNIKVSDAGVLMFTEEFGDWRISNQFYDEVNNDIVVQTNHFSLWKVLNVYRPIEIKDVRWIATSESSSYTGNNFEYLVEYAFKTWEKILGQKGINFKQASSDEIPNISIQFKEFEKDGLLDFNGTEDLGSFVPGVNSSNSYRSGVIINDLYNWDEKGELALVEVLIHEIGHALGMDHACPFCSAPPIMAPKVGNLKNFCLYDDDIEQLEDEYAFSANADPINNNLYLHYDYEGNSFDKSGNNFHGLNHGSSYVIGLDRIPNSAVWYASEEESGTIIPDQYMKYISPPFTLDFTLKIDELASVNLFYSDALKINIQIDGSIKVTVGEENTKITNPGYIKAQEWVKIGLSVIDEKSFIIFSDYNSIPSINSSNSYFRGISTNGYIRSRGGKANLTIDDFKIHRRGYDQNLWSEYLESLNWERSYNESNYELEYISGNIQTYSGGGLPNPMVFKIKNQNTDEYINGDLSSQDLSLTATASKGYQDAEFNDLNNYCENGDLGCYGGYYYVEPLGGAPPYVLNIDVELRSNGELLDIYEITQNIGSPFGTFIDPRTDGYPDIASQTYKTVQIGEQVWMAENLRYIANPSSFTPNDYYKTYGVLYNYTEAMESCPSGWHLSSNEDWYKIVDQLGGLDYAGGKLKEIGTVHWKEPNTGASDDIGFAALPAGIIRSRYSNDITGIGELGSFWSSTLWPVNPDAGAHIWTTRWYSQAIRSAAPYERIDKFAVRCVKDDL